MNTNASYSVPPVSRAFRVLRHIAKGHNCANVNQAALELGIARTTLIRLLQTLVDEGALEPLTQGQGYRLGLGLVSLASAALSGRELPQCVQPVLAELAGSLGLSAYLGVREGDESVYLAREAPESHLVSNIRIGSRLPLHATTIGRVLLATASVAEQADYVERHPESAAIAEELRMIEDDLYWSLEAYEPGVGSCAVAIRGPQLKVVGAINLVGPVAAFTTEEAQKTITMALQHAAQKIRSKLATI